MDGNSWLYRYSLNQQVLNNESARMSTDVSPHSNRDEHPKANKEIGHITNRYASADCYGIITYACVKPTQHSHNSLQVSKTATRPCKEVTTLDPFPSSIALNCHDTNTGASCINLLQKFPALTQVLHFILPSNSREMIKHYPCHLMRTREMACT